MTWRSALPGLVVALALTFAGCFSGDDDASSKDPETVAQEAFRSFGQAASSQDGGDIKKVMGSFRVLEDPEDSMMDLSGGAFDLTMEWGRDGVSFISYRIESGGMSLTMAAWCSPDRSLLQWGGEIYESRIAVEDEEGACDLGDFEELGEELDLFETLDTEGVEIEDIETHKDGSMTVHIYDPGNESRGTAKIDKNGRLTKLTVDDPEMTGSFEITYGKRDAIKLPPADARIPASLEWEDDIQDGTFTGTITSSPERPLLDELEIRVVLRDWQDDSEEILASAPLGPQPKGAAGYTFAYQDVDGDGRASENDTFTIAHPDWADVFWIDETILFYDKWADGYANESPVPAPGLGLLVAAGLGLAFLARRKRA